MRRAPIHPAAARAREVLALVVGLGLAGPARAQAPGLTPPPADDHAPPASFVAAPPAVVGPPPAHLVAPARPVIVELRFTPDKALRGAQLRLTPTRPGAGTASERPIFGPTMTLALPPGHYALTVHGRRHEAHQQLHVAPGMRPVEVQLRRAGREAPRFRDDKRLVTALAGATLIQVFTGAGLLIAGAARETSATRRNEALLMDALVDAAAPVPQQPTGLALVEATYPTARYHRDLARAMTLGVAGGAVAMAGLGAGFAALPVENNSRLRVAYVELGLGAAMTAGGAVWLSHFVRERSALLAVTDPTGRVTTTDLRRINAARVGGALLTGLGVGLLVFPAVALLTHAVKRRHGRRTSLAPYMAPGQAGLAIQGRF